MIHTDTLNSLTEDERSMLLFIINIFNPPLRGIEADLSIIKSYKYIALCGIIKNAKGKIKENAMPIYEGLCQKFNIQK